MEVSGIGAQYETVRGMLGKMISARQGKKKSRGRPGSYRACAGCHKQLPREQSIRLVADPEGRLLPDIFQKLQGRGVHLCPSIGCLRRAIESRMLSRALHAAIRGEQAEEVFQTLIDTQRQQIMSLLAVANRCQALVTGRTAVAAALSRDEVSLLLLASDVSGEDVARRLVLLSQEHHVMHFSVMEQMTFSSLRKGKPVAVLGVCHRGIGRRLSIELNKLVQLQESTKEKHREPIRHLTAGTPCGKMPGQLIGDCRLPVRGR